MSAPIASPSPGRVLRPKPLTAEDFAPFGDIIEVRGEPQRINYGNTFRFNALSAIDVACEGGSGVISIFRSKPLVSPIEITVMERHPLGSQAFVPLSHRPYLVVVAPPGGLVVGAIQAFLAEPHQGVNYARGALAPFLSGTRGRKRLSGH